MVRAPLWLTRRLGFRRGCRDEDELVPSADSPARLVYRSCFRGEVANSAAAPAFLVGLETGRHVVDGDGSSVPQVRQSSAPAYAVRRIPILLWRTLLRPDTGAAVVAFPRRVQRTACGAASSTGPSDRLDCPPPQHRAGRPAGPAKRSPDDRAGLTGWHPICCAWSRNRLRGGSVSKLPPLRVPVWPLAPANPF